VVCTSSLEELAESMSKKMIQKNDEKATDICFFNITTERLYLITG
jgi:hypothetical protein